MRFAAQGGGFTDNTCFGVEDGCLVVNDGVLDGRSVMIDGKGVIINNGTIAGAPSGEPGYGNCASFWVQGEGTLVNYGTVEAGTVSRFWDSSLCLNMGTGVIRAYDFYLVSGNMANFGQLMLQEWEPEYPEPYFGVLNESRLVNCRGGRITVAPGARFDNGAKLRNFGDIVVKNGGSLRNTVLENDGFFQAEYGSRLDEDNAGIYCGSGEYRLGSADVKTYHSYHEDIPYGNDGLALVNNEENLRLALDSEDVEEVCITGDITLDSDWTFHKRLYVAQGCGLVMEDGASLTGYGGILTLESGASLSGGNISLYDGSQICLCGSSLLDINPGGMLTLDASLLWGWAGILHMDGADFVLKNQAGFYLDGITAIQAADGRITVQDGAAFVVSSAAEGRMRLERASIVLPEEDGAYFHVVGDAVFRDCGLELAGGRLYNRAESLVLENCQVIIGERGRLDNQCAGLSLQDGSTMEIWGGADINGWAEHTFVVQGQVTNHGTLNLFLPAEISVPIDNQGSLYYSGASNAHYRSRHGRDQLDLSKITGNAPVDVD